MESDADARWTPQKRNSITVSPQLAASVLSDDGRWIYAGGFDGAVRRWSLQPLLEQLEDDAAAAEPAKPKRSPKAPELSLEEELYAEQHHGWPEALALRGDCFVSSDSWGALCCWDASAQPMRRRWRNAEAHDGWIRSVAVSPDGRRAATCGRDQFVRLWDVDSGSLLAARRHRQDLTALAFHLDGRLFVGDARGAVMTWPADESSPGGPAESATLGEAAFDASALYKYDRIQDVGGVKVLAVDGERGQLAVAGGVPSRGATVQGLPTVLLFDIESGELQRTWTLGAAKDCYVHALRMHPAGFWMAVTCGTPGTGQLVFFRPEDEEPFYVDSKVTNPHSLSFSGQTGLICIATTNRGSNGNGRRLNADGEYQGNSTPLELLSLPASPAS